MIIPKTIEANSPPAVISSVSLVGLESVVSDSSMRFHRHNHPQRFGNSSPSNERPVVKPTRKRSTDALSLLDAYNDCSMQNATFDDDRRSEFKSPKLARLENVMGSDASYASATSYRSTSQQDHLMERYLKLVEDAKRKSDTTAPQMPQRKASMARRIVSSTVPLSMPVRKASLHNHLAASNASKSRRGSV